MITGKLIGIGLGAGNPDLITVKALRALQQADIIFYPTADIQHADSSFSSKILKQLQVETPMQPFHIPMKSAQRMAYYQQAYHDIKAEVLGGKNVAVVSEGDLLFYSTFGYLLEMAKADALPLELISGIPAFIAASALSEQPIIEGDHSIQVIALPKSFQQITQALEHNATVVVMKIKVLKDWYHFLKTNSYSFFYAEKIGTSQQFITSSIEDLKDRQLPYFALLILKQNKDKSSY